LLRPRGHSTWRPGLLARPHHSCRQHPRRVMWGKRGQQTLCSEAALPTTVLRCAREKRGFFWLGFCSLTRVKKAGERKKTVWRKEDGTSQHRAHEEAAARQFAHPEHSRRSQTDNTLYCTRAFSAFLRCTEIVVGCTCAPDLLVRGAHPTIFTVAETFARTLNQATRHWNCAEQQFPVAQASGLCAQPGWLRHHEQREHYGVRMFRGSI